MPKGGNMSELEAQAEFMRQKLAEARKRLESEPLVIEYNNGGGQSGTRENPEWIAYEKLLKSYHATLRAIAAQTGAKAPEKQTGTGSPLKNFRTKYNGIEVAKGA